MGRTYTSTGISMNFGGTAIPSQKNIEFTNGTQSMSMYLQSDGEFYVFGPNGQTIIIEADSGKIKLFAQTEVEIDLSGTATLRVTNDSGTVAELTNGGNLNIAGSLGTGVSF